MNFLPVGKFNPKNKEVIVIGAGISGLAISYFLAKQNYQITLIEAKDQIGGKIQSIKTDYGLIEKAANSLLLDAKLLSILEELELEPIFSNHPLSKKFILKNSPYPFFKKLQHFVKIFFNLFKKTHYKAPISVYDFFSPLLGKKLSFELLSTILGGIYGSTSKELDIRALIDEKFLFQNKRYISLIIKVFIDKKKNSKNLNFKNNQIKSKTVSFQNGMNEICNRLFEKTNFKVVLLNTKAQNFTFDKQNIIITTPSHDAYKILEEKFNLKIQSLKQIQYQKLSSTSFICNRPINYLTKSFGVLFSPESDFYSLGVIAYNEVFNINSRPTYKVISKKMISENLIKKDLKKLEENFDIDKNIINIERINYPSAIPIYSSDLFYNIPIIDNELNSFEKADISIFSNYLGGISLKDILNSAKDYCNQLPT